MERKSKVLLIFTIFSLFLVGLYFTNAANTIVTKDTAVNATGETGFNLSGRPYNSSGTNKWTAYNATDIFNFTVNNSGPDNVKTVNITNSSGSWPFNLSRLGLTNISTNATGTQYDFNWTIINRTSNTGFQFLTFMMGLYTGSGRNNISMTASNVTTFTAEFKAVGGAGTENLYNWNVTTYDINDTPSSILLTTGVDGSAPRANANTTNVTQSVNPTSISRTANFNTGTFVRNDTELNITFTVTDYNLWKVLLVYNNSGGTINLTNISDGQQYNYINLSLGNEGAAVIYQGDNANVLVMNDMATNSPNVTDGATTSTAAVTPSYVFRATLKAGNFSSDGTPLTFAFVVFDLYNQSAQVNNSNAVFRVVEDGLNPTVTVTEPSDTSVATSSTTGIKYICAGDDNNNTIASYSWLLTKPGGDTVTKTTATATFSTADIDKAGTYNLKCTVTDQVGNEAVSTLYEFTGHVTSSSSSGGSGGGAGGAGTAQPALENDLSVKEEVTISKQQGRIVSFTLDGQNVHKMTFKEVTASKVTLVLESEPVEVTLEIGETKSVDIDRDGTDDVELKLESIKNGVAQVTTKKLAAPTSDTTTTTLARAVTTTTPVPVQPVAEEKASLAWLWILVVIVVIIVIVVIAKRKKR